MLLPLGIPVLSPVALPLIPAVLFCGWFAQPVGVWLIG
jgi:hypothetical protein